MHVIYNYMSVTVFYSNYQSVVCLSIHMLIICVCVLCLDVFLEMHMPM